jgi:hypothetical protein
VAPFGAKAIADTPPPVEIIFLVSFLVAVSMTPIVLLPPPAT